MKKDFQPIRNFLADEEFTRNIPVDILKSPGRTLSPTTPESFNQDRIMWDKLNCTYWWTCRPDFSHKKWFKPIEEVRGYSKRQNHNEAKDKNMLLITKIIMLCVNGYIQSCRSVEIFKRPVVKSLSHGDDQLIVTFYDRGKKIVWNNYVYTYFPKDIVAHMAAISDMIMTGRASDLVNYLPRKKPGAVLAQHTEDKNKLNFPTPDHVLSWGEYQVKKKGADFKAISDFTTAYIKEHFPDYKFSYEK